MDVKYFDGGQYVTSVPQRMFNLSAHFSEREGMLLSVFCAGILNSELAYLAVKNKTS